MIVLQIGTASKVDGQIDALPNDSLALLGTKIMDVKRSPDLLGHFDPAGLAILLPETDRQFADRLAQRIANLISQIEPADWTNWKPLQYMIGVAGAPENGASLSEILAEACKYPIRKVPT